VAIEELAIAGLRDLAFPGLDFHPPTGEVDSHQPLTQAECLTYVAAFFDGVMPLLTRFSSGLTDHKERRGIPLGFLGESLKSSKNSLQE